MQLLIQHGQRDSIMSPVFHLWAKFELKEEELALLNKYKMHKAIITEGNTRRDVIKSTIYGTLLAMVVYLFISFFANNVSVLLLVLGIPILTYLIYNRIRERIKINDIINGRSFSCHSISTLMEKEQAILNTAVMFREFLEAMKTWGGKGIIEIEPATKPQLRIIEPPHAAE
jgi:hypothetical protein